MMRGKIMGVMLALAWVAVAGCGRSGGVATEPVSGVVTYQGQPLAGVQVGFTPESGRGAVGVTDASGRFTLATFEPGDGAVPGKHKVTVAEAAGDEPQLMPGMPGYDEQQEKPLRFPAHYTDVRFTKLEVTVESGKKNDFTLELTDD